MRGLSFRAPDCFERVQVVLLRPSHPGNVGAVARAMRVMGLHRLAVVAPRHPDVLSHPDAVAFASGAAAVLAEAQVFARTSDALESVTLAVAVSAQGREFGPVPHPPEALARQALDELAADPQAQVAFVFGPERTGLSIEDTLLCQALLAIPTDPEYGSLNLAQAVQVVCYGLATAARQTDPASPVAADAPMPYEGRLATHAAVEGLFAHLERSLVDIGFIDPRHPKKLMPRLRRLLSRSRLEVEEVDILRGVCTQIDKLVQAGSREKT